MSGNTGMFNGQPLIQVQDLGKSFGSIDVLKGITVDIHKGGCGLCGRAFRFRQKHLPQMSEPAGGAHKRAHFL